MMPICFFHRADLDGICSAAIVRKKFPDAQLIGVDYGDKLEDFSIPANSAVYVVDFSFPIDVMIKLEGEVPLLVWIDHHVSAIKEAEQKGFHPPGVRQIGTAACELAWNFLFGTGVPEPVELLAKYDVWNLSPTVLEFQYGMKALNANLSKEWQTNWDELLEPQNSWPHLIIKTQQLTERIMTQGKIIHSYAKLEDEKYVKRYSYVTEFEGLRALVCNKGNANSLLFDSIWDPEKHDVMCAFTLTSDGVTYGLYTTKPDIDCSEIAKKYGGGGHRAAAGFKTEEVLF